MNTRLISTCMLACLCGIISADALAVTYSAVSARAAANVTGPFPPESQEDVFGLSGPVSDLDFSVRAAADGTGVEHEYSLADAGMAVSGDSNSLSIYGNTLVSWHTQIMTPLSASASLEFLTTIEIDGPTRMDYSIFNRPGDSPNASALQFYLMGSNIPLIDIDYDASINPGALLLGAGTYRLAVNIVGEGASGGGSLNADLNFTPVPVPAAAGLLLSGLLGLAGFRRRSA
jgi:hypothetical protein